MKKCEIPLGTFQLIYGENHAVTQNLVAHPNVSCIAFTGSLRGGSVLSKIVSQREKPIPFHAEMGSLNPVIALPNKIEQDSATLAQNYIQAVNLFAGQMCTKPGAFFILKSPDHSSMRQFIKVAVNHQEILPMLNGDIYENYEEGINFLKKALPLLATNESDQDKIKNPAYCRIFELNAVQFIQNPELRTEAFGPASLFIECKNEEELFNCIKSFEGSLTGSLHCSKEDGALSQKIIPLLESKVGRLLWNGFPPGVTPGLATHHGGPWPATTDSRYTSIGKEAYQRFVRPLCKQGFPETRD
jgi:NADP-dependent aldehyde dehydrogenase